MLEAAFGRGIEAGMTTIDVGGIPLQRRQQVPARGLLQRRAVWQTSAPVRNVSDFKTVTNYRLVGKDQYEQVAPGGEAQTGARSARRPTPTRPTPTV